MKRAQCVSTFGVAEEAANEALGAGGSALKAAVTGFFAAAGASPGVLFSPISLLVAGLGFGARAYDGRTRQPGREAKRPRGFAEGERVPDAARVAIPASLSALALACAYDSTTTLLSCSRVGVSLAKTAGAKGRAELIDLAAGLGSAALGQGAIKRAFLGAFGPAEGGVVSASDLIAPAEIDGPALTFDDAYRIPEAERGADADAPLGAGHVLLAVDVSGQFVALAFRELDAKVVLEPFEVAVPLLGVPVLRGVPRVTPGTALPTPAYVEVRRSPEEGTPLAVSGRPRPDAPTLSLVRDRLSKELTRIDGRV